MARMPQVTRTIKSTKVKALCVNTETAETFYEEFTLARTFKDKKAIMKKLSNCFSDPAMKVVSIVSTEVVQSRYGMTEDEFIAVAREL